jgi:hypothetical protein
VVATEAREEVREGQEEETAVPAAEKAVRAVATAGSVAVTSC